MTWKVDMSWVTWENTNLSCLAGYGSDRMVSSCWDNPRTAQQSWAQNSFQLRHTSVGNLPETNHLNNDHDMGFFFNMNIWKSMEVSCVIEVPPSSSILDWDFPGSKPSILIHFGYLPCLGNLHIRIVDRQNGVTQIEPSPSRKESTRILKDLLEPSAWEAQLVRNLVKLVDGEQNSGWIARTLWWTYRRWLKIIFF